MLLVNGQQLLVVNQQKYHKLISKITKLQKCSLSDMTIHGEHYHLVIIPNEHISFIDFFINQQGNICPVVPTLAEMEIPMASKREWI